MISLPLRTHRTHRSHHLQLLNRNDLLKTYKNNVVNLKLDSPYYFRRKPKFLGMAFKVFYEMASSLYIILTTATLPHLSQS